MKSVICLLVDRFHSAFLGPYGNGEIETPTLNRLAAESFLADRFYVDTPDPILQCRSWWQGRHVVSHTLAGDSGHTTQADHAFPTIMAQLNASGYRTVLMTDDPMVAHSLDAGDFADVQLLAIPESTTPCEEIEHTHLCAMLATIAATAESLSQSGSPFFLWCHLRGFDTNWDFPLWLREQYRGEDDPAPWPEVTPPYVTKNTTDNESPLSPDSWDDFRQSVVSAYAAGVTMFDELLEMLTEPLRVGEFGSETLFLLAGTRGVLFGECDVVGIPASTFEPMASSLVQPPLIVRFPDGRAATVRSDAILQPADVTQLLREWLELPLSGCVQTAPSAWYACRSMLALIDEEPQKLREHASIITIIDGDTSSGGDAYDDDNVRDDNMTCDDNGSDKSVMSCLVTPTWFLQQLEIPKNDDKSQSQDNLADQFALYVKPDDRWDVNNVADRCVEIVEQLFETLYVPRV